MRDFFGVLFSRLFAIFQRDAVEELESAPDTQEVLRMVEQTTKDVEAFLQKSARKDA